MNMVSNNGQRQAERSTLDTGDDCLASYSKAIECFAV